MLYAALIAIYWILRFGGNWLEQDTSFFTRVMQDIYTYGTLVSPNLHYPFGFGYPAVSVFILNISGIPPQTLQLFVYPFLVIGIGVVAFVLFREFVGDARIAALATFLLYFQPEFLLVTLRGSHEKLTWPLTMIALLILAKSFACRRETGRFATWVVIFYLVAFALITSNAFFASTFLFALAVSFLGSRLFVAIRSQQQVEASLALGRLAYVAISCFIFLFLFTFYIYTPAYAALGLLRTALDKIAALLFNIEVRAAPYEYILYSWGNPRVYLAMTAFNWSILPLSLGVWLYQGYLLWRRDWKDVQPPLLLLWLFYPAFAIQLAVSLLMDFAGVLGANMQVRLFPAMMLLAIPLASTAIFRGVQFLSKQQAARQIGIALFLMIVVWFAGAALLKANSDPLLSNNWMFYSMAEKRALGWTDQYLRYASIWIDPLDARLREVFNFYWWFTSQGRNYYDGAEIDEGTRYILISDIIRMRGVRGGVPLPDMRGEDKVYDSGSVGIFHLRPRTPYQR